MQEYVLKVISLYVTVWTEYCVLLGEITFNCCIVYCLIKIIPNFSAWVHTIVIVVKRFPYGSSSQCKRWRKTVPAGTVWYSWSGE